MIPHVDVSNPIGVAGIVPGGEASIFHARNSTALDNTSNIVLKSIY
jgi:hypothetical protein